MKSRILLSLIVLSPIVSMGQVKDVINKNHNGQKSSFDFSALTWTAAFDSMHATLSLRYPFSEWKGVNWDEKEANTRPVIVNAESLNDEILFTEALYKYLYDIPDGHIELSGASSEFKRDIVGGTYGFNLIPASDGTVLVTAIIENSNAWNAGLRTGDRIVSWNGEKVDDIKGLGWKCYARNYSTLEGRAFANYLMLPRNKPGDSAVISFISNGSKVETVTTLYAFDDGLALYAQGLYNTAIPLDFDSIVKYRILQNGVGYLYIGAETCESLEPDEIMQHPDFIAVKEAVLHFNENNIDKLIVDLRFNLGGNDLQAAVTMGLFYENQSFYEFITGSYDDDYAIRYELITEPLTPIYNGEIAVLIDPNTISTGEGLAMMFQRLPNVTVIGNWGTNGAFGMMDYDPILLPEGLVIKFPQGRSLNQNYEIQLDSDSTLTGGVYPDIYLPVNIVNTKKQWEDGIDVHLDFASSLLLQIDEGERNNEYSIYPNPCTDYCNISISGNDILNGQLRLFGEDGIIVFEKLIYAGTINRINLKKVPPGLYVYQLLLDSSMYSGKLLVY